MGACLSVGFFHACSCGVLCDCGELDDSGFILRNGYIVPCVQHCVMYLHGIVECVVCILV